MTKRKHAIYCTADEDRTKQSFRDECDMNRIVSRINKTGFIPLEAQSSLRRQLYGDFTQAPLSLEQAYDIVHRANIAFALLPARLRERFGSPAGFLEFIEAPENLKEAQDLGLLVKNEPTPISEPNPGAVKPSGNNEAVPQAKPAKVDQEPAK